MTHEPIEGYAHVGYGYVKPWECDCIRREYEKAFTDMVKHGVGAVRDGANIPWEDITNYADGNGDEV